MTDIRFRPLPVISLALAVAMIVLYAAMGPEPAALVYDRTAITDGAWWRLVSAHLVHADASHLALNVLGFIVLGVLSEQRPSAWFWAGIVSIAIIDAWLWLYATRVEQYCGLSGVLYGLFAVSVVSAWRATPRRWIVTAATLAVIGKTLWEGIAGAAWIAHTAWPTLPGAHYVGFAAGLLVAAFHWEARQA